MRNKLPYKLPLSIAAAVVAGALLSPVVGASDIPVATWTGAAGTNLFSTAGNWKEGKVPANGAKLVFNCVSDGGQISGINITNDLPAVKIAEISTLPTEGVESCKYYSIGGDTKFQDNVKFSGVVKGEYNIGAPGVSVDKAVGIKHLTAGDTAVTVRNASELSLDSYTAYGAQMSRAYFKTKKAIINSTSKQTIALSNVSESLVLQDGAAVAIPINEDTTLHTAITFQGGGSIGDGYVGGRGGGGGGAYATKKVTLTLAGDITVNGTVIVHLQSHETLRLTGNLKGSGKIMLAKDSKGTLINEAKTNETKTEAGAVDMTKEETITLDGDKIDDYVTVERKQTAVLKGSRGDIGVNQGGVLKGEGTVENLSIAGILSPGNSPGKIIVLERLYFGETGVYIAELLNKDTHDKVIAGKNFDAQYGGNAVEIKEGATLKLSYLPNGIFKKGDVLTIIDNQSKTPVKGIFKDLPEGAEVRVGSATFMISYKGGDGNDVTLTAQNDSAAPKAPNTGVARLVTSPVTALAAGVAAVVALFAVSKRRVANKR